MKRILHACLIFVFSFAVSFSYVQSFSGGLKTGDGSARFAVAAYFEVEPAKREAFLQMMMACLEASQKEKGALEYTLWADMKDPNTFFLYEEYASLDAYREHGQSAHFNAFIKGITELGGVKLRAKEMNVSPVH